MRSSPQRDFELAFVASVILTVVFTWPMAPRLSQAGRVDASDARHGMWNVAWVAHALTTDPANLFNANIFYPHRNALAFSEANLVAGIIALPAWVATKDALTAFNWTVLSAFVLASLAMFALVRHLTDNRFAAGLAALLFAWSPYMYSRLSHLQLLMTFGLPLTLLALHRFVAEPRPARAVALGFSLALTGLSSGYYGVCAGLAVSWGLAWFGLPDRLRDRAYWAGALLAVVVAGLVVFPFFIPYIGVRADGFERSIDESRVHSALWRSYLATPSLLLEWILPLLGDWRRVLFPGTVTVVLAVRTLVELGRPGAAAPMAAGRRLLWFYVTLGAWSLWLSLGPDAGLYSWMYDNFAVFAWLRAPARFGVMVTLALAVLAAAGAARLGRPRVFGVSLAGIALAACALAEAYVGPIQQVDREPPAEVYRRLAELPSRPVAEFPYFTGSFDRHRHTEYMLAATFHWRPLVNGSSDHTPSEAFADGLLLSQFPKQQAWPVLARRGVSYIVIHWTWYEPGTAPIEEVEAFAARGVLLRVAGDQYRALYQIVRWPDELLRAQHAAAR